MPIERAWTGLRAHARLCPAALPNLDNENPNVRPPDGLLDDIRRRCVVLVGVDRLRPGRRGILEHRELSIAGLNLVPEKLV